MKKVIFKIVFIIFLAVIPIICLSQESAVDAGKLQNDWLVAFKKSTQQSDDVNEYGLSMYFLPREKNQSKENRYLVDNFDFNTSPPVIVTVFYTQKDSIKYAIVLVRWHISALGAETLADYYQINAYKFLDNPDPRLVKDEKISQELGEGYDGQESGETKHFYLKTASDIRKKFKSLQK